MSIRCGPRYSRCRTCRTSMTFTSGRSRAGSSHCPPTSAARVSTITTRCCARLERCSPSGSVFATRRFKLIATRPVRGRTILRMRRDSKRRGFFSRFDAFTGRLCRPDQVWPWFSPSSAVSDPRRPTPLICQIAPAHIAFGRAGVDQLTLRGCSFCHLFLLVEGLFLCESRR